MRVIYMLELTDENMKYVGLGVVVLFSIYILYRSQQYSHKIVEGLVNNSASSNYAESLKKLPTAIASIKKGLNVSKSRSDIEDILTNLTELVELGQLNTLLQYANSKMDPQATANTAQSINSFSEIKKSLQTSIEYLDSMKN